MKTTNEYNQRLLERAWEIDRELSIRSYYAFFKLAWKIIEPNTPLQLNWHLEFIADLLQKEVERIARREKKTKDFIINVPPGTSKSSLITILLPAWIWINYPYMRIISGSYAGELSTSHAQMSRDVIESDWYQDLFGDRFIMKRDLNRAKEYQNNKTGIRIATSVGGSITGKHADIVIIDDPLNPKEATSEKKIARANHWMDKTLPTRLRDPEISLRIVVMQRLHENDLTGHCLATDREGYEHICLPGEKTEDVRPIRLRVKYKDGLLNPSRQPRSVLTRLKVQLGSDGYSGQILQNPIPAGGNMIKKKWFGRFSLGKLMAEAAEKKEDLVWNFKLDGAYTKDEQNDPSAMISYCMWKNNMYIREVKSVWKELPELIRFIKEFTVRNDYSPQSMIGIEPKASGMSAAQSLKRETNLNVILDKAPKIDKIARVNSCLPFMEAGRCFLLEDCDWSDHYLNQLAAFPNAKHDDEVDVTTMAINSVIDNPNKILDVGAY